MNPAGIPKPRSPFLGSQPTQNRFGVQILFSAASIFVNPDKSNKTPAENPCISIPPTSSITQRSNQTTKQPNNITMTEYRIVVLGGGGVGKSALTVQFISSHFVEEYDPTIEDSYRKQIQVDDETCLMDVLDTAGQEEFAAMRDSYMRSGEGFIYLYSIVERASFEEISAFFTQTERVKDRPFKEIPTLLAANKVDLDDLRTVDTREGSDMAKQNGMAFFEVSAKTRTNVDEVFFQIVREIRNARAAANPSAKSKAKKKKCLIL